MTQALTTADRRQIVTAKEADARMAHWLDRMQPHLERALAGQVDAGYFARVALTQFKVIPKLRECDPVSFLSAVMFSAQLKMEPGAPLGFCWIIPRGGQATFQLGYQGSKQLMYRSQMVAAIRWGVVREGDHFIYRDGLEPILEHEPNAPLKADRLGAWAALDTTRGGRICSWLPAERIRQIKNRYVKAKSGPWYGTVGAGGGAKGVDDPEAEDEMWKKTALVRLAKIAPLELDIQRAMRVDEAADHGVDQGLKTLAEAAGVDFDSVIDVTPEKVEPKSAKEAFKASAKDETPEHLKRILSAAKAAGITSTQLEKMIGGPLADAPPEAEGEILSKIKKGAKK